MHKRFVVAYRLFFGGLTLLALLVQLSTGLQRESFSVLNFFSFFTIESNILAALIFLITGFAALKVKSLPWIEVLRGAATVYMITTGLVYAFLLAGLEESLQTPIPWVNAVLHYIMPLAVLVDWFMALPARRMQFRRALVWLLFPLAYVAYSLIRGSYTGWYPYPFLNPDQGGYGAVIVTGLIIAVGITAIVWLIAWTTRLKVIVNKPAKRTT